MTMKVIKQLKSYEVTDASVVPVKMNLLQKLISKLFLIPIRKGKRIRIHAEFSGWHKPTLGVVYRDTATNDWMFVGITDKNNRTEYVLESVHGLECFSELQLPLMMMADCITQNSLRGDYDCY